MGWTTALAAALLRLPPAAHRGVRVTRDLAITAGDGTVLLADRYCPADQQRAPVVLVRTPYGRRGPMSTLYRLLAERGYQCLVVSVRGTGGSGGRFDGLNLEAGDGAAVVEWLRGRDWFPGAFATWGLSYLGHVQWELARESYPEWRLAMILDAPAEYHAVSMYPGGVFTLATSLGWVQSMYTVFPLGRSRRPWARQLPALLLGPRRLRAAMAELPLERGDRRVAGVPVPFFQGWLANEEAGPYWRHCDHRGNLERMPPRVHLACGWQDPFLAGLLADRAELVASGRSVRLLVGPWRHAQGVFTGVYLREVLAALDAGLAGRPLENPGPVGLHVTGAGRWREFPAWPPPGYPAAALHLLPDGRLGPEPVAGPPSRFRYDPADPTPSVGGPTLERGRRQRDNRALEARADVLTFTGPPLPADLELVGPVNARIWVRSSSPHSDLFVRVCAVDPDGGSVNLTDAIRRLGPGTPPPGPDGFREVRLELWPLAHRFRAGQRIRVQVSGGAFPRFVRNHGTGEPIATAVRMVAVDQEVGHGPGYPSAVWLPMAG